MPRLGLAFQQDAAQAAARRRATATTAPCGHSLDGFRLAWDVGPQTPERAGHCQCLTCGALLPDAEYVALRDRSKARA